MTGLEIMALQKNMWGIAKQKEPLTQRVALTLEPPTAFHWVLPERASLVLVARVHALRGSLSTIHGLRDTRTSCPAHRYILVQRAKVQRSQRVSTSP